jgi:hypothetical protein
MGYEVSLIDEKGKVLRPSKDEMVVTYNYQTLFKFRLLRDRKAKETQDLLKVVVDEFGTTRDPDYYKCTKGNVGYTCSILLKWALEFPEATWKVVD